MRVRARTPARGLGTQARRGDDEDRRPPANEGRVRESRESPSIGAPDLRRLPRPGAVRGARPPEPRGPARTPVPAQISREPRGKSTAARRMMPRAGYKSAALTAGG